MTPGSYHVRRERGTMDLGWLQAQFSFSFGGYVHPQGDRFGPLVALNEDLIQPSAGFPMHPHRDLEILMIPLAGAIAHEDSLGNRCEVHPGQVLLMRAGRGIWHSQFNASASSPDHHLQIWIEPSRPGLKPMAQLATVGVPELGQWQLLAGPAGVGAQLQLAQDATVRRVSLLPFQPLPLAGGMAEARYLHVVAGSCDIAIAPGAKEQLSAGDAVALEPIEVPPVLTANGQGACEVLLVTFPLSLLRREAS